MNEPLADTREVVLLAHAGRRLSVIRMSGVVHTRDGHSLPLPAVSSPPLRYTRVLVPSLLDFDRVLDG